jgi:hypothetical protein
VHWTWSPCNQSQACNSFYGTCRRLEDCLQTTLKMGLSTLHYHTFSLKKNGAMIMVFQ